MLPLPPLHLDNSTKFQTRRDACSPTLHTTTTIPCLGHSPTTQNCQPPQTAVSAVIKCGHQVQDKRARARRGSGRNGGPARQSCVLSFCTPKNHTPKYPTTTTHTPSKPWETCSGPFLKLRVVVGSTQTKTEATPQVFFLSGRRVGERAGGSPGLKEKDQAMGKEENRKRKRGAHRGHRRVWTGGGTKGALSH